MNESLMQHGLDYAGQNLAGWHATEKFDGCRAYWDGAGLWTRGGVRVALPEEWRAQFPAGIHLDGELYFGVGGSSKCAVALVHGRFLLGMQFIAFDCPSAPGNYLKRMAVVRAAVAGRSPLRAADIVTVESTEAALGLLRKVHARGGEGLMLRHSDIEYRPGRSGDLRKLKVPIEERMAA